MSRSGSFRAEFDVDCVDMVATSSGVPAFRRREHTTLVFLLSACIGAGWFLSPVSAQLPAEFEHVSFTDGLVNSSVSSIAQDDAGFLWFGTQGGLQRYDGYGMLLYTAEPFNRNSLSNQLVQTMFLDGTTMWIGTYTGLNRLDIVHGDIARFTHVSGDVSTLSNNVVTSIARDGGGSLWVATLDGLNRLDDESTGEEEHAPFTRFVADPEDSDALPHNTVRSLYRDSSGRMWVGSLGGLSLVERRADGTIRFRTFGAEAGEQLRSPYVMTITGDSSGKLWLGTWDGGLSRFDPDAGTFDHYALPDNRVYTVMVTSEGLVYAGTWGGGLYILDPRTGEIAEYRHDPDDWGSLAHDVVYSLFEDRSGIIWIGTNGNGINKFDGSRESFRYIHRQLPEEKRLDSGKVQALWADPDTGDLYAGLQNNGLNVVDGQTGVVTRYRHEPADPDSISSDTVNGILPEPDGTILISTHDGVNRFYPPEGPHSRGRFSATPEIAIDDPIVYRMRRDTIGRIWFGTYNSGVFLLEQDGTIRRFAHDPRDSRSLTNNLIYDILEDSLGVVWIATNGGLNRYVPDSNDFDRFVYDPDDRTGLTALSTGNIFEDSTGTLWIGTRSGGLNRLERETDTFRHYTVLDELSSNTITAIREGAPGELYLATPNGLNLLTTEDGRIRTLDERDGLYVREFSTGSTRGTDGSVLFGAFSEVIRVPTAISEPRGEPPDTVITDLRVMNEAVAIPLDYSEAASLELAYDENFLAVTFAVLGFSAPARNTYRYRLVGFDAGWIEAETRRSVSYTNLPPGTYEFQVIGTDAHGLESTHPAKMAIRIRPPFWRTPWFMAGIAMLITGGVAGAYLLRVRALHRVNRLLEETVAERTALLSEANEVKDRFFSIIAHDLRGPVSGMESLSRHAVRDHENYSVATLHEIFSTVHTTSAALLGMLENLLEWARVQSGRIEFTPQSVPIRDLLLDVTETNRGTAQVKGISLDFECSQGVRATADLNMLRVVIQNLVNNAIKFTPSGGSVRLCCSPDPGDTAVIEIIDNGVGIPPEKIAELFRLEERYRTTGTAGERGSGFGLSLCRDLTQRQNGTISVKSDSGGGTTVTVTLPSKPPDTDR